MRPIRFLPEAQAEFDQAIDWHEEQRAGRGLRLLARIQEALGRIAAHPESHRAVYEDVRRATLRHFPYVVLYRVDPTEVVVVSIFHTARDPNSWRSRLGSG